MYDRAQSVDLDRDWWRLFHGLLLPYFRGLYGEAKKTCASLRSAAPDGSSEAAFLEVASMWLCDRKAPACAESATELAVQLKDSGDAVGEMYARLLAVWAYSTIKRTEELGRAITELVCAARLADGICDDSPAGAAALRGRWLIYQFRAHVHYYLGRAEDAVDDYNEAIELVNRYVEALRENECLSMSPAAGRKFVCEEMTVLARPISMRAMIYFEEGDFRSAVRDLEIAHEVDPRNAYVLALRGLVEYSRSEYTVALEALDAAVELVRGIGVEDEVSGRPEYLRALLLQKIKSDRNQIDSRHGVAIDAHEGDLAKSADELFTRPFDRYIKTHSPLEALSCLLLCTDLSKPPTSSIARMVLWELLYGVDGHDDFMSKLCTFQNWNDSMLKIQGRR